MALTKVVGIETEYGIWRRHAPEQNPVSDSSLLVSAYLRADGDGHRPRWGFEAEHPDRDARGVIEQFALAPEVETHLANALLTNGARFYVDHAHPEYSSPEVRSPRDAVIWDRAGEEILRRAMGAVAELLPAGEEIVVYKNNSDGKGNSYGCHENFFMDRATPFDRIVAHFTPFLVTRQVFAGAGKVGGELPGSRPGEVTFQISQRSDFFEEEVGLETTLKRPLINTRDEPHADPRKYRRLHVILGDANRSEWATALKLGSAAIVLAMIEDDWIPADWVLAEPVEAVREVSRDLSLRHLLELRDGRRVTAVDLQLMYADRAADWASARGWEAVGEEEGPWVLAEWQQVLADLAAPDPVARVSDRVDWAAKLSVLEAFRRRHGAGWGDPRLAALDLQYHDLRPERSIADRLPLRRLVEPEEVARAVDFPPTDTRAYFRGHCVRRFASEVSSANWDSLVFDTGSGPLARVPMPEPLRGTEALVGDFLAAAKSSAELITLLGRGP